MPEPVTVTVEVARPRQEVFDYVDVAANHERWMDHFFKDWRFEGPPRGVGAITKAQVDAPGAREQVTIEVVESVAPDRIVEEGENAPRQAAHARHLPLRRARRRADADRIRAGVAEGAALRTDPALPLPCLHAPRQRQRHEAAGGAARSGLT